MRVLLLSLLLVFSSKVVLAVETSIGSGTSFKNELVSFQLNYRGSIWSGTYFQFKGGYFDGIHVGTGGGLLVDLLPVQVRGGTSMGTTVGISVLELNTELYVGLKDRHGNSVGLQFDRLSDNGRNYLTIQMSQDL